MNINHALMAALTVASVVGCISVKTESEVKPIHITMDINLKVDKQLDKAFSDENMSKPNGDFKALKAMLDRKVAGMNNKARLEARQGATDEDKMLIAEANIKRAKRLAEIARESGVSQEAVEKRFTKRFREKAPAGSGIWFQGDDGKWIQL